MRATYRLSSIRNLTQEERADLATRVIILFDVYRVAPKAIGIRMGLSLNVVNDMLHGRTCPGLKSIFSDGSKMRRH